MERLHKGNRIKVEVTGLIEGSRAYRFDEEACVHVYVCPCASAMKMNDFVFTSLVSVSLFLKS